MPQVKASPKTYDAVVVGSGAGGGIAAHILTLAGAKVCMLEAGGDYNTAKQSDMFKWNYDAPHRAAGTFRASPTPRRPDKASCGIARACWADAPITTGASRCAWVPTISNPIAA